MPYFDRLRQLAAAHGTPGRRRTWGLEIEDLRPAAAALPRAAAPAVHTVGTTPSLAPAVPSAPSPTRGRNLTVPTAPQDSSPAAVALQSGPMTTRREVHAAAHVDVPAARPESPKVPRDLAPVAPDARAGAPPQAHTSPPPRADARPQAHTSPPPRAEFVSEAARVAPATDLADLASAPSSTPPLPETAPSPETAAASPARVTESPETTERAHRALAEVRRWMEEPPSRRQTGRPRARRSASAAAIAEPSLSIGTIEVTVEAAPAPQPAPPAPPPSPPRRAGRNVVPRDYLRGW